MVVCVGFVARAGVKMLSKRQSRRGRNLFITARNALRKVIDCQSMNSLLRSTRRGFTSRRPRAMLARCENNQCIAPRKMAADRRVGCAASVADTLCCLEFHLACH